MHITLYHLRLYPAAIVISSMLCTVISPVYAESGKVSAKPQPYEQELLVTAYYSPVEGQYAYYRGDYDSEKTFNGNGVTGADGTKVYAGMLAAPASYAFGTEINLPGIGVGTVHDRGGRIIEWDKENQGENLHRIDVWMGTGEEGLARALSWGARRIRGTVYPLGTVQPRESIALDTIAAPVSLLLLMPKSDDATYLGALLGQKRYAVKMLQGILADLGYLKDAATGYFGVSTQTSLLAFQQSTGIDGDGSAIDQQTYAALEVAKAMRTDSHPAIASGLRRGSRGKNVQELQRTLRYLGFYRGRTDGMYGKAVIDAVTAFQLDRKVILTKNIVGAGMVGTKTSTAIIAAWRTAQIRQRMTTLMLRLTIADRIKSTLVPAQSLAKGDSGKGVRSLQVSLSELGYFPKDQVQGSAHFGELTKSALIQYQLEHGIIRSEKDKMAGNCGPATRSALITDLTQKIWRIARAEGIDAAM